MNKASIESGLTFASSVPISVIRFVNSICMGLSGSPEGASFGGVTRGGAVDTRAGVLIALFPPVVVTTAVAAPGFAKKDDPVAGTRGSLAVAPKAAVWFDAKRGPGIGVALVSDAGGSVFGKRLNAPGLRPGKRLVAGVVAGFVGSSTGGFVSGFTAVPSGKPPKFRVGIGDATGTTAAATAEEDEVSLRAIPFPINNGGVFGLVIADGVALAV